MKYSEKIEIAVPLRVWVVLLRVLTNSFETLTSHSWRLLLQKRVRLCSIFGYFVNYKQLTQKNRKYFIIVKEIAITEKREYILYIIVIFYQLDNFMKLYMH